MGAVFLLLVVIVASMVCVRAGAIALELTGVPGDRARFQALSAFTNTGFTTRESEEIIRYPVRRRIVTVLIVLGHAGTVSVIATLASSLLARNVAHTAINIGLIGAGIVLLLLVARWQGLTHRMADTLRRWLLARYDLETPSLEEILSVAAGFGVLRAKVPAGSPLTGRPLAELPLKSRKVQILAITRGDRVMAVPLGTDVLQEGDELVCYGLERAVGELFGQPAADPA